MLSQYWIFVLLSASFLRMDTTIAKALVPISATLTYADPPYLNNETSVMMMENGKIIAHWEIKNTFPLHTLLVAQLYHFDNAGKATQVNETSVEICDERVANHELLPEFLVRWTAYGGCPTPLVPISATLTHAVPPYLNNETSVMMMEHGKIIAHWEITSALPIDTLLVAQLYHFDKAGKATQVNETNAVEICDERVPNHEFIPEFLIRWTAHGGCPTVDIHDDTDAGQYKFEKILPASTFDGFPRFKVVHQLLFQAARIAEFEVISRYE